MRVLFLIPKNPPPQLEGNFSKAFKEFVGLCLQKDPEDVLFTCGLFNFSKRPTAKELLKHRFIKSAKKTSMLIELIERRQRWLQVVQNQESDEESEKEADKEYEFIVFGLIEKATTEMILNGISEIPLKNPSTILSLEFQLLNQRILLLM